MKNISAALLAHIQQQDATLATCWKVTLTSGTILGFTDHDQPLVVDGVTYEAQGGYSASDVASGSNLDVDNLEVAGFLESPSITEDDLRAGVWDNARIQIFQVNWADLSMGTMRMRTGHLGEVSEGKNTFKAELLGLLYALQNSFVEITSASCRAELGDARCGVSLTGSPGYTVTGTVDSFNATTLVLLDASNTQTANYFAGGKITFTGGLNIGLSFEIKSSASGSLTLQLPPPYAVSALDTYSATAGCDKSRETCRDRFANVINFRGEPFLQGNDKLVQIGRQ